MAGLTVIVAAAVQAAAPQPVAEDPVAVNDEAPPATMPKVTAGGDETHAPGGVLELVAAVVVPAVQVLGSVPVVNIGAAKVTVSPDAKPSATTQTDDQDWSGKPDVSLELPIAATGLLARAVEQVDIPVDPNPWPVATYL